MMKRDNFLNTPAAWTRASRHAQTPVEYACAVQHTDRATWRWVDAVVAVAAFGALVLMVYGAI